MLTLGAGHQLYACDTCVRMRSTIIRSLIDGMGQASPSATGLPLMLSSQASYVIVSGLTAALGLDTYPLSNLIRPPCAERAKRGRGKPVLITHIGFYTCFHAISLECGRFSKIATNTQNDYCNPRCACAQMVN